MYTQSYNLVSKLSERNIYDVLSEEQLRRVPVVNIEKNTVFIPAVEAENMGLYYILDGVVEVISQSYNGRSFLIDTVMPGEFIGKFSNMRKQNFYSDIKTQTSCKLLNLTALKNELLNDEQFMLLFSFKTSNRLYEMYKIGMMRTLFTYEEILSYCLLELADETGCISSKDKYICLKTSISERQYYYIMKKFRSNNIIGQNKKKICILEREKLEEIAFNIINFMKNRI